MSISSPRTDQARCHLRAAEDGVGLHFFKTLEWKPALLLGGKNAGKLWDPKNLALKCESAIITGSEQQQKAQAGAKPKTQLSNSHSIMNAVCTGSLSEFYIQLSETK